MKICFVGLGSIGTRHLKNIITICNDKQIDLKIHAFRKSKKNISEDVSRCIDREVYDINNLDSDYDIVFITNPTYKHYESIVFFKSRTKHMFIEKPVFDKSIHDLSLILPKDNNLIYYVAAPLRYTSVIEDIKQIIEKEVVYSVRVKCSSYLPSWRPGVDYRNVYSAHKDQGGGVSIDCIHELDYIVYLFGFPEEVINVKGKYSHLEIDSDDLSVYILRYKDKIIEVHLDYFGKERRRDIEILTKEGMIVGDLVKNQIRFSDLKIKTYEEDNNLIYIKEMECFIDMINGKKENSNSLINANKVLSLAEGVNI